MPMDKNHLHCHQLSTIYEFTKELKDKERRRYPIELDDPAGCVQIMSAYFSTEDTQ